MVYCVATIQEIQRLSCVAPLPILHSTTKDVVVEGYKLKKGQGLMANLTKFLNDPEVFPQPKLFNPERFIENSGDNVENKRKLKVFIVTIETNMT